MCTDRRTGRRTGSNVGATCRWCRKLRWQVSGGWWPLRGTAACWCHLMRDGDACGSVGGSSRKSH